MSAATSFVPGVTIDLAGFQPNIVSVRGVPANHTPLTVDGNPIASAATSGPDKVANTADGVVGRSDRTINWGASVDRPRFSTKLKGNYTDPRRPTAVIGGNVPAGADTYLKSRLQIDVNVEWRFSRRLGADATVCNRTNRSNGTEADAPNPPADARTRQIDLFDAADTSGRKGSF